MKEEFIWAQKYRPTKISECVLPKRIKKTFIEFLNQGDIPTLMLSGTAGTGKTTVAKALCNELGCDSIIINASTQGRIETLRTDITHFASTISLLGNSGRKIIILDEADGLTAAAQAGLKAALEEFSSTCGFIFTCNLKNKIIDPIHSRCTQVDFSFKEKEIPIMMGQFMKRVQKILECEGIKYDNAVLAQLIKSHFPDFRRTLNELQRYAAGGEIDSGILSDITSLKIDDVINLIKQKNFKSVREWVGLNSDMLDSSEIYSNLYRAADKFIVPSSVPTAVVLMAEYSYKEAFVADKEINLVAFLTELMGSVEFES
jgi:DNA polymerase III delta prime subunit